MTRLPACLVLWLCAALPAQAETYRVDLIVFVDLWKTGGEAGQPARAPNLRGALDLEDKTRLRAAGIEVLPDAQFGLPEEWQRLRNSKQFKPLLRLSWTQKDPPSERGPSLHLQAGAASTMQDPDALSAARVMELDGSVALLLGRYLHLDADLQYTADGQSWKLGERRRMKRDEVHHLDSARLGILTQVSKVEAAAP